MKTSQYHACLAACFLACAAAPLLAAQHGVTGYWQEPGGSVLHVEPCGDALCATLVKVSKAAPRTTDSNNPDTALRERPLCGIVVGTGFHAKGDEEAEDGKLYDPKSGKTYNGSMRSEGEVLHLRGYLGMKAFGRTEDWTRTTAPESCAKPQE